ncbi:hypothetical protein [Candidatus Venteria ishoeyi]|uniref:Uncharacterized protein n=1 Tax=Candidatus Venteria ishoeyi TaxID=1899563 RepID=A0A1H6F3N2_9GAMM|nr:hypothetical protein [Candidatus Venteria ishoeyi]SEH04757.1 Uncharacterised protein [Candidatus Venteria ishoeyi]
MKRVTALLLSLGLSAACLTSAYAGGLNEYEHISGDARLTANKYRALRYVLPDEIYKMAMKEAMPFSAGGGINIGTVLPGVQAPREMNIFIDGDVINLGQ